MNNIQAENYLINVFESDYFIGGAFMFLGLMLMLLVKEMKK